MLEKMFRRIKERGIIGKKVRTAFKKYDPDFVLVEHPYQIDKIKTGSRIVLAPEIAKLITEGCDAFIPIKSLDSKYIRYLNLKTGKSKEVHYRDELKNPYYLLTEIPAARKENIKKYFREHKGAPMYLVYNDTHVTCDPLIDLSLKEVIQELINNRKTPINTILLIESKEGTLINMETGWTERKKVMLDPGEVGYND